MADPLPTIRTAAERVAASSGLELFDIQFRRESSGWVLRVILDRPDEPGSGPRVEGVTLGDCQRVSRDLSAILDVEDVIDRKYTLEVTSPGLDRPLRHEADYQRFAGRLAKIVVARPVEGQSHFTGRLKGVEDGTVLVEVGRDKVTRIPLDLITRGRLDVEF